ncbi:MAG: glutamate-1-semialdehyde 2,1-aminomutase [Phycisphaerae bacterium]|nr:glutamate-1-semialdehyde 2,1-aminomutase [Phycisphaerae bacterium]
MAQGYDFSGSAREWQRAGRVIPGGVNSPVRAYGGVDEKPVLIASGQGCRITDIDGNEYIDYVGSWGPLILGHAHPKVVAAIQTAAQRGTTFGAPTLAETDLAERIVKAMPSIQKVRMVSSGTEAVMTAIRLARAHTGRDYVIKMNGCYHGHSDGLLVAAGSGLAEHSTPSSAGVPRSISERTIVAEYNDIPGVERAFEEYHGRVAGLIVEPIAANMGVVLPDPGYLKSLRQLCDYHGTVLIFDEVITGFRVAYGGAQAVYGICPDLTCLGKIIGGGLPAAAVGGKAAILDLLSPLGPVYQAGTLSGNPLAMAAAITTLDVLGETDSYQQLETAGSQLQAGIEKAARKTGITVRILRAGSMMSCYFTDRPVRNLTDVKSTEIAMFKRFFSGLLRNGVYIAPSAYEALFVSLAHSPEDIHKTIEIICKVFQSIRR